MKTRKLKRLWSDFIGDEIIYSRRVKFIILCSIGINFTEVFIPMYIYLIFQNIVPNQAIESLISSTLIVIGAIIGGSILKQKRKEMISVSKIRNHYSKTNEIYSRLIDSHTLGSKSISMSTLGRIGRFTTDLSERSVEESFSSKIDMCFGVIFLLIILVVCGPIFSLCVVASLGIFTYAAKRGIETSRPQSIIKRADKGKLEDCRNDYIDEVEKNLMRIKLDNLNTRFVNEYECLEIERVQGIESEKDSDIEYINKITALSKIFSISVASLGAILVVTGLLQSGLIIVGLLLSTRVLRPLRDFLIESNRNSIIPNDIDDIAVKPVRANNSSSGDKKIEMNEFVDVKAMSNVEKISDFVFQKRLKKGKVYKIKERSDIHDSSALAKSICRMSNKYTVELNKIPIDLYDFENIRTTLRYIDLSTESAQSSILEVLTNFRKAKVREAVYWSYICGLDKHIREYPKGYKTMVMHRQDAHSDDNIKIAKLISNIIDNPSLLVIDLSLVKYGGVFVEMFHRLIEELAKTKIIVILGGGKVIDSLVTDYITLEDSLSRRTAHLKGGDQ